MSEIHGFRGLSTFPTRQDVDTSSTGSDQGKLNGREVGKDVGVKLGAPEHNTRDTIQDLSQRTVVKNAKPQSMTLRFELGLGLNEMKGWSVQDSIQQLRQNHVLSQLEGPPVGELQPPLQDVDINPQTLPQKPESGGMKPGELQGIMANWSNNSSGPPLPGSPNNPFTFMKPQINSGGMPSPFSANPFAQQSPDLFAMQMGMQGSTLNINSPMGEPSFVPQTVDYSDPTVLAKELKDFGMEPEVFQPYRDVGLTGTEARLLKEAGLGPDVGKMYREANLKVTPDTLISEFTSDQEIGSKELGSGAFNTVLEVSYQGDKVGVFKALPEIDGSEVERGWTADRIGIDAQNPQTAMRNLGTVALAKTLGFNVVTDTRIGEHEGKLGLVMDKALGEPGWKADQALFKDPEVRRELTRLQLLDALVGQGDRHANNYFIHKDSTTGKVTVTGIDNDQCFGKDLTDPNGIARGDEDHNWGFRGVTLPPVVDRATAEALLELTPDDLDTLLGDKLLPEEVDATKERLKGIQAHLDQLELDGKVLENTEDWGSDPVSQLLDTTNSYAGRDGYVAPQLPDQDLLQQLDQVITPTF